MNSSMFRRYSVKVVGVCMALFFLNLAGRAQAFVSAKTGVDVGSCLVTAPCRTITYSLNQAVEGGVVNVIDSGNYDPFVVTKSVTVQAAPGIVAVITRNTAGPGVSIEAQGIEYITIRGLTLILPDNLFTGGTGVVSPGFAVTGGGTVLIERCVVRGFTVGIDAKMVGALFIRETSVSGGTTGMNLVANYLTLRVTIDRCQALRNSSAALNATTVPLAMIRLTVLGSQFWGSVTGFNVAPDPTGSASVGIENCEIANNKFGLQASGAGATVRVSNSTIFENGFGLAPGSGAALLSRGNNTVEANSINGDFTGTFPAK